MNLYFLVNSFPLQAFIAIHIPSFLFSEHFLFDNPLIVYMHIH